MLSIHTTCFPARSQYIKETLTATGLTFKTTDFLLRSRPLNLP